MTPVAKSVIGIFLVALFVAAGYYYWVRSNTKQLDGTERSTIAATQSAGAVFQSKLVDLSFTAPVGSTFQEEDSFNGYGESVGKQVYFRDTSKQSVNFDATTTDFMISDSVPHDLLPNIKVLDANTDFQKVGPTELGSQVQSKLVRPGMHLVVGYNNIEMTTSFPIYLLVEAPKDSGLKYISFYLGDNTEMLTDSDQAIDYQGLSLVTDAGIKRVINLGLNEQLPLIQEKLVQAIAIAETFTAR